MQGDLEKKDPFFVVTPQEFLEKALWSTEPEELTLIPRLEFADGVSKVSQLLSIYPKDQTTKDQTKVLREMFTFLTSCKLLLCFSRQP